MPIRVGTDYIQKAYFDNEDIQRIYLGEMPMLGVFQPTISKNATDNIIIVSNEPKLVHSFTSNGKLIVTEPVEVEYLIVGGGGGGGYSSNVGGAGGGAGGFLTGTTTLNPGIYDVVVGAGGVGGDYNLEQIGTNGGGSSFNNLNAFGGGRGGASAFNNLQLPNRIGADGGSGGGGVATSNPGGLGTAGQGNNGGAGSAVTTSTNWTGGGGGGAGQVGGTGAQPTAGKGGDGLSSDITGTSVTYAGGGGGGYRGTGGVAGAGGTGGGGAGGTIFSINRGAPGGNGINGLGGGGGGGTSSGSPNVPPNGGNGGSGIVIIRAPHKKIKEQLPLPLLFEYPGAFAGFSFRDLTGQGLPVVRIRRASDNVQQDFNANQIEVGVMSNFLSGTTGFVHTWYDQSGNNKHLIQTTSTAQLELTQNLGKPAILCLQSNRWLSFSLTEARSSVSIFLVRKVTVMPSLLLSPNSTSIFLWAAENNATTFLTAQSGTPKLHINGNAIDPLPATRSALGNLFTSSGTFLETTTEADLTSWGDFRLAGYPFVYGTNSIVSELILYNTPVFRAGIDNNIMQYFNIG